MTIILERLCISPTEAIRPGEKPYMQQILLHDRSLSSVARDESRMAGGEPRMAGGEPRMTGDYCRPEESIHRCVRTHSYLYSSIYGLVALLDNIQ